MNPKPTKQQAHYRDVEKCCASCSHGRWSVDGALECLALRPVETWKRLGDPERACEWKVCDLWSKQS